MAQGDCVLSGGDLLWCSRCLGGLCWSTVGNSLMAAGACVQFLEPRTVSICNTGIPLLCIFMLKRKCHNKGNMAADDGCTFPVISNEIVLNGWNVVFWKSQVVCTQRMWNCSPGTGELELHQRG